MESTDKSIPAVMIGSLAYSTYRTTLFCNRQDEQKYHPQDFPEEDAQHDQELAKHSRDKCLSIRKLQSLLHEHERKKRWTPV